MKKNETNGEKIKAPVAAATAHRPRRHKDSRPGGGTTGRVEFAVVVVDGRECKSSSGSAPQFRGGGAGAGGAAVNKGADPNRRAGVTTL